MLCTSIEAQTLRGRIGGFVVDENDTPVVGASVRVVEIATSRERKTASDPQGDFLVTHLLPGRYRLEVESPGFQQQARELVLLTNQELRVHVPLITGQRQDQIVVTAARSVLRTESAAVGGVLENHLVRGLPLDGRNFLELSLLLPGVAPAAQGSAAAVRGDVAFNVNGSREDSNNYLLDGVYNGDPKLNGFAVNAGIDAIQEFELAAGNYDASFGRNAGGQVNVVTARGGNQWHGSTYYFARNAALDARNFFAPANETDPKYQRHQYGASLGGPIIRNRTFLFADFESLRLREGVTLITNVPTAAERSGDFSAGSNQPIDPFSGQPLTFIPEYYQHPVGRAIVNLYPLPNRDVPGQNYASSPSIQERNDQFDARVDQALGLSGDFTARYSFTDDKRHNPFSGPSLPAVPGFGVDVMRRAQNLMLSETHSLTPNWVNEVRAAYNRVSNISRHENFGTSLNTQVGLPELSDNPRDFGLSYITLTGYSALGDDYNNPQHSVTNTFQLLDNVTHARGNHLFKFGFEVRHTQQNAYRDIQSRGLLNFVGITGNAVADLLLGYPAVTGGATLDNPQYLRATSTGFYGNDSWRIVPSLTLSMGVRYEYNSPPVDKFDRANTYDPATGSLVPVGLGDIPRAGYLPDRNNWAPRVGLAWRPGNGTTVLRTGYGLYFDQSALAPGEGLYFNAPYYDFRLMVSPPLLGLPGDPLTLSDPFPADFPYPSPPSALAFQRDLRTPYVQHWSFNVQQQLGENRVFEIGYVGSKGTKLIAGRDINQPQPSPVTPNPRPNPLFADATQIESRSDSNYHSLQARFQQYLSAGASVLASYTWAKSIDDASSFFSSAGDASFPQDSYNVAAERGRSNFDVRHRLALSYSWDIPFGTGRRWGNQEGLASAILGGWQTFGIWTFQSGRPFTVALLSEIDNSNTGRASLGFGANDRPHLIGEAVLDNPTPERWFNTDAFVLPEFGTFGNSGRNILDGPGLQNINVSLLREFPVAEGTALQFRAEAFNLLNRANFELPDIFYGSPTFGRISSAKSPRRIQFGLKLLF